MKFFKHVEILIRMFIAIVLLITYVPMFLVGFIVAEIIDAFQAGIDVSNKLCNWITKD